MALADRIKTLDDKIKADETHYNLDGKVAKISALSSGELGKNEYFTGEDLALKLGPIEKTKFKYFPLGEIFNDKAKDKKYKTAKIMGLNLFYDGFIAFQKFKLSSQIN